MSFNPSSQERFIPDPDIHLGEDSRRLDTRCTQVAKYLERISRRHFFHLTVSRLARLFSLHPNTLARSYQRKPKRPPRETPPVKAGVRNHVVGVPEGHSPSTGLSKAFRT